MTCRSQACRNFLDKNFWAGESLQDTVSEFKWWICSNSSESFIPYPPSILRSLNYWFQLRFYFFTKILVNLLEIIFIFDVCFMLAKQYVFHIILKKTFYRPVDSDLHWNTKILNLTRILNFQYYLLWGWCYLEKYLIIIHEL